MAYIGGGAQGPIDWKAREGVRQLTKEVAELQRQVAELQTALAARDEAPDTVGGDHT
ncbi:MAG TPA: hypothetical protein VFR23_19395 [Jiangellaceae bacterium]|nr:hypothetical protein [Jiangellaceae bacterium]